MREDSNDAKAEKVEAEPVRDSTGGGSAAQRGTAQGSTAQGGTSQGGTSQGSTSQGSTSHDATAQRAQQASPKRPIYVVIALIVSWFLGMSTAQEGYMLVRLARNPLVADSLSLPPALSAALVDNVGQFAHLAVPVGVAQMLLGGLLLLVSAALLFGARTPLNISLQVIGANAALAVSIYFFAAPLREALMQAVVSNAHQQAQALGPEHTAVFEQYPESLHLWLNRMNLMFQLGALGAAAFALTRPAARRFFNRPVVRPES